MSTEDSSGDSSSVTIKLPGLWSGLCSGFIANFGSRIPVCVMILIAGFVLLKAIDKIPPGLHLLFVVSLFFVIVALVCIVWLWEDTLTKRLDVEIRRIEFLREHAQSGSGASIEQIGSAYQTLVEMTSEKSSPHLRNGKRLAASQENAVATDTPSAL